MLTYCKQVKGDSNPYKYEMISSCPIPYLQKLFVTRQTLSL